MVDDPVMVEGCVEDSVSELVVEGAEADVAGSGSGCACSGAGSGWLIDRLLGWLFRRSPNQPGLTPVAASATMAVALALRKEPVA